MTFTDGLHYIAVGNPVSKAIIGTTASIFKGSNSSGSSVKASAAAVTTKAVSSVMPPLWKLAGRNQNFVRIAGLSGASAVVLKAVGAHKIKDMKERGELMKALETANKFHFLHSVALLGVPLTKRPVVTGLLMIIGTTLSCGILYHCAFTGETRWYKFSNYGYICLMLAWLSMMF